ncbi:MAG: hypothetical protein MZV70_44710 [Desulfobacterales bacterium]|nr:hypothetical protein [Desulfobacterales bacterium]
MQLTEPDPSAASGPVPVPGSEFELECDQVIPAIGQSTGSHGPRGRSPASTFSRWGTLEADPVTYSHRSRGVFAGGDASDRPRGWPSAPSARGKEAAEIHSALHRRAATWREGREPVVNENPSIARSRQASPGAPGPRCPQLPTRAAREATSTRSSCGYDETAGARGGRPLPELRLSAASACQCVKACLAKAVDHSQKPETLRDPGRLGDPLPRLRALRPLRARERLPLPDEPERR